MQIGELRKHLNDLCDLAQEQADPAASADLVLEMLPEEFDAQLSAMVTEPETFQGKIGLICPRCNEFAPWFESLRAALEEEFTDDPDEEEEEEEEEDESDVDHGDDDLPRA